MNYKIPAAPFLNSKFYILNSQKKGFTLIEILVVLAILSFLTAMLVVYSRASEQRLALFREQSKLVSTILRSKSLSIQTYRVGEKVCGYGVHFDSVNNRYLIFKDLKINDDCSLDNSDKILSNDNEIVEIIDLKGAGVILSDKTNITDVFFQPPDPKVFLTPAPMARSEASIFLTVPDEDIIIEATINSAGQVSAL